MRFVDSTLRRTHILITERQYRILAEESERSGLSMAVLVRRAIDATYRPGKKRVVHGWVISGGVWREPDAAFVGRPKGRGRVRED
jgi:hypothetical protein